ncbi:CocE/NonD family hydrolase [Pseudonocardia kujensis]|uniref:CocE/NonD family hydrolase n=1 Tax=Pseudonocardia kujensis TaxID=1128675 RepID=UPI001E6290B0|nr:CocE/NonD family hydrolase [Pseudonocardia kujensis]MCE0763506.1 CocE/NonD family hydrolase [Pseudonocardia kujensis]
MSEAHFDFATFASLDFSKPDQVLAALGVAPRSTEAHVTPVQVPMRDGIRLAADHYAPVTGDSAPTILVRSPYGRGFPYDLIVARVLAGAGYHVLLQSCRGTADSQGELRPMVQEANDGQDTVEWLRSQTWFDGRLGLVGMSYLAHSVYALLEEPPAEVKAAVLVVPPYEFNFMRNGAFTLEETLSWSDLVRRRSPGHEDPLPPDAAQRLPLTAGAELLGPTAPWYAEWISHPEPTDPYWHDYDHHAVLARLTVPTLLIGGTYDAFLPQTVGAFQALQTRGVESALTLGPWVHTDVVGPGAAAMVEETEAWLNGHLRADAAPEPRPTVRLYVHGAEEWRELSELPKADDEWDLRLTASGTLSEAGDESTSVFTYDPADPTPTVGGRRVAPDGGARDNAPREERDDVLVFTTDPLPEAVEIHGNPKLTVGLSSNNAHADLHARLCVVDQNGRSTNFSDAMLRLPVVDEPGAERSIDLTLDFVARKINHGERIRLQISGGSFPEYDRNLGSGEPSATGTTLVSTTHRINHATTRLALPTTQAK